MPSSPTRIRLTRAQNGHTGFSGGRAARSANLQDDSIQKPESRITANARRFYALPLFDVFLARRHNPNSSRRNYRLQRDRINNISQIAITVRTFRGHASQNRYSQVDIY